MGMNVNLTPQLEELVRSKVASGLYTSASEVVREALRLMDEQDRLRAAKLEQLRDDIHQGLNSGPSKAWNAEDIKRRPRSTGSQGGIARDGADHPPAAGCGRHPRHRGHIAEDSIEQADQWVDKLSEKFGIIATQPSMGRARNELVANVRSFPFGR